MIFFQTLISTAVSQPTFTFTTTLWFQMMCPLQEQYNHATIDVEVCKFPLLPGDEDTQNLSLREILLDLERSQQEFGYSHEKVAEAWNALGLIRVHMQRDAKKAKQCHENALRIFQCNFMPAETAITLNDLGYCYEQLSEQDRALEVYREALHIMEELKIAENHPRMLSTQRAVCRLQRS
jgi:tetratricopeptide (TPR) repeat protein